MSKYLIDETTLSGIANKIRVLSDTENTMTPAEMQTALDTHNTEMNQVLATQDNLIAQITTALEGKAGGGINVETCTVEITFNENSYDYVFATVFDNNVISRYFIDNGYENITLNNVVKGTSIIIITEADTLNEDSITGCDIQELMRKDMDFNDKVCFEAHITGNAHISLHSSSDIQ